MTNKNHLPVVSELQLEVSIQPEKTKLAFPTGKPHISYSELHDWMECSWRHKLKHIDKLDLDGPTIHTEFGQVVHDAMETYLMLPKTERKPIDASIYQKMFKDKFDALNLSAETPEKQKELQTQFVEFNEKIVALLEDAPKWMDIQFPDWETVAAEDLLYEPIPSQEDIKFKGFVDAFIKVPKRRKVRKPKKSSGAGLSLSKILDAEEASEYEIVPGEFEHFVLDWKGQRLSAPILTPNGWTTMGELQIGTEVIGSNGKPTKVSGIYPLGEREVYRVTFRDKSFVDCTDDHLWRVVHNSGNYQTVETKKLMDTKSAWYVDAMSSPVEYNSYKKLLIEPYRLGVVLGDGHIGLKEVKVTSNDQEIFDSFGSDVGYVFSKGNTKTLSVKNCISNFREYGLVGCRSHEKFVPEDYLFACPSDRLSLLQGLMDTDGWVQKGCAKFSTVSEKLAIAVVDLTNSLGGVTFHSTRPIRKGANFVEHIITVRLPETLPPFRLSRKLSKWNNQSTIKRHKLRRKIESVEIVGKDQMQCIRVEANDHLYVTNDYIVTHNTSDWGWTADKKRDFNKQLQIMLYKIFYCQKMNLDLKEIKCGFVLLKRKPNKEGSYCEFVPVSVGEKSMERALSVVNSMVNQVKQGRTMKNRWSCRFCKFANTKHCM